MEGSESAEGGAGTQQVTELRLPRCQNCSSGGGDWSNIGITWSLYE